MSSAGVDLDSVGMAADREICFAGVVTGGAPVLPSKGHPPQAYLALCGRRAQAGSSLVDLCLGRCRHSTHVRAGPAARAPPGHSALALPGRRSWRGACLAAAGYWSNCTAQAQAADPCVQHLAAQATVTIWPRTFKSGTLINCSAAPASEKLYNPLGGTSGPNQAVD